MQANQFAAWMKRQRHDLASAGAALDMSGRMIRHYRDGTKNIPLVVALACEALARRRKQAQARR